MKYICDYNIPVENDEGRYYALSAVDKASYIHDVLVRLGYTVEIISPSWAKKTSKSRIDYINDKISVVSGFSLGWTNSFTRVFSRISVMIWLFFYLLKNCKKGEKVISYHGVQKIPIVLLAKRIKGFDVILEVEELYSSLIEEHNWRQRFEKKMIKSANSFIFASEVLERRCNAGNKPYVIAYGSYKVPPFYAGKKEDGKKHIVYAGLIKKDKVAFKSVRIAKHLGPDYYVHIIGYGEEADINELKKEVEIISKDTKCGVSYDGLKRGTDYLTFLQSCHYGICPLTNDNTFQLACFPSKITSYLSNGLDVITTENAVLRNSQYRQFLHFVKDDNPESFAQVITGLTAERKESPRDYLVKMDEELISSIKRIF